MHSVKWNVKIQTKLLTKSDENGSLSNTSNWEWTIASTKKNRLSQPVTQITKKLGDIGLVTLVKVELYGSEIEASQNYEKIPKFPREMSSKVKVLQKDEHISEFPREKGLTVKVLNGKKKFQKHTSPNASTKAEDVVVDEIKANRSKSGKNSLLNCS